MLSSDVQLERKQKVDINNISGLLNGNKEYSYVEGLELLEEIIKDNHLYNRTVADYVTEFLHYKNNNYAKKYTNTFKNMIITIREYKLDSKLETNRYRDLILSSKHIDNLDDSWYDEPQGITTEVNIEGGSVVVELTIPNVIAILYPIIGLEATLVVTESLLWF